MRHASFGGHYKTERDLTRRANVSRHGLTDWDWRRQRSARSPSRRRSADGKTKWEAPSDIPRFSGVLSTAGGVVFSGQLTGEFEAFDADSGKKLWQFQTGSAIEGQP